MLRAMITRLGMLVLALGIGIARGAAPDVPFYQDRSEKFPAEGELAGAAMKKVHVNKDGIVYVLTDRGMARLFGDKLALDRSFRPFNGKKPIDSAEAFGEIFYLFEDALLCNGFAGKVAIPFPPGQYTAIMAGPKGEISLSGLTNSALVHTNGTIRTVGKSGSQQDGLDALAYLDSLSLKGARDGVTWTGSIKEHSDVAVGSLPKETEKKLEQAEKGIYRIKGQATNYYGSKRWLLDDDVVDFTPDQVDNGIVLTKLGLNKIIFEPMTLEEKAQHFQDKIRKRHIRFGFCAELRLARPGDPTSAEMIDTDNDGTWSEYYLASQAFRFGATGDPEAHAHAWETFAAMERLESINNLGGFPARTLERKGYKVSDVDRWRDRGDGLWEWKGHTSSDEITAHMFGCSVLWECAAKTKEERERIKTFVTKIADHLLRNNLYLIDVDGKPTLWGRWNPEYVNWFPHSIVDRRLNSAEIVGLFQFAYAISGDEKYKAKGMELLNKFGYLENIVSPMSKIAPTKGFVHQGNDMGDEWNHSDDLLSFDAYWVLYRWAFNSDLKKKYAAAIRDHWQMEKAEKNPYFAFVYASTKPKDFDLEGALWTLRRFPLDMVDWTVQNSHRQDITKLPPSFRGQELKELLPPGERRITRWNSHPFVLDGGSGGHIELAGDEFLLPYWMGRYLKIIAAPKHEPKRDPIWP
jgi:hypothetical protein